MNRRAEPVSKPTKPHGPKSTSKDSRDQKDGHTETRMNIRKMAVVNSKKSTVRKQVLPQSSHLQERIDTILLTKKWDPQYAHENYREITSYLIQKELRRPKFQIQREALKNVIVNYKSKSPRSWSDHRLVPLSFLVSTIPDLGWTKSLFMIVHLMDYCAVNEISKLHLRNFQERNGKNKPKHLFTEKKAFRFFALGVFTATKYCQIYCPSLEEINTVYGLEQKHYDMFNYEQQILDSLDYKVEHTSEEYFVNHFLVLIQPCQDLLRKQCQKLLITGLFHPELSFERPSLKALAIITIAKYRRNPTHILQDCCPEILQALTSYVWEDVQKVVRLYLEAVMFVRNSNKDIQIKKYFEALNSPNNLYD